MTPRLMLLPLALALVATITFASGESDTAAAAEKEMVLDPTTGEMVTAPEYGGTIRAVVNFKNEGIDPYYRYNRGGLDRAGQREARRRRLGDRPERGRLYHAIPAR